MSILIKGMKMPITCDNESCCGDCDFCNHIPSHETDFYEYDGKEEGEE